MTSEGPLLEGWKEGLTLFDVNRNLLSLLLPSFRSINRRDGSNRVIISSGGTELESGNDRLVSFPVGNVVSLCPHYSVATFFCGGEGDVACFFRE